MEIDANISNFTWLKKLRNHTLLGDFRGEMAIFLCRLVLRDSEILMVFVDITGEFSTRPKGLRHTGTQWLNIFYFVTILPQYVQLNTFFPHIAIKYLLQSLSGCFYDVTFYAGTITEAYGSILVQLGSNVLHDQVSNETKQNKYTWRIAGPDFLHNRYIKKTSLHHHNVK